MRKTIWLYTGLCAGLLMSGGAAIAQSPSPQPAQDERTGASDREFMTRALGINQLELKLGKMATERASTPEVKAMAKNMVQKHTVLGQQLSDVARRSGISETPELSPDQQGIVKHLEALSGADFDRSFQQTLVAIHVQELALWELEASRTSDPQLRALAQTRAATLQQTLNKAAQPSGTTPKGA